jgi:glycosyltransferase involved in cell wall biosynthesis
MSVSQKPKILIAISNIAIGGGAEKVAVELAKQLEADNQEVVLLTFYSDTNEHAFSGARVSRNESTPTSVFAKVPRAFSRISFIKRMCRENKIDTVISFLEESNYYCLLSKVLLQNRVPMIVSVRLDPRFYNRLYKFFIRHLYPHATKVVAVTKYVEKVLRKEFSLTNTTTIYNPIDQKFINHQLQKPLPEDWKHLKNENALVVSIGRLTKQKGQWHLIRAFTKVVQQKPSARLLILGAGEYQESLKELISSCGLTQSVQLAGKHANVYPFLATSKLFVFTSLWEGMPNTVLEALASGLPIVATDCDSGPREIIAPEITIDSSITYPYQATYGTLLAPFDSSSEPVWENPTVEPLSNKETALAESILQKLDTATENRLDDQDKRFELVSIRKQWQVLANLKL